MPYLIPGVSTIMQISDALADESFYACGIATGSSGTSSGIGRKGTLISLGPVNILSPFKNTIFI
jgi:hypothetical protein